MSKKLIATPDVARAQIDVYGSVVAYTAETAHETKNEHSFSGEIELGVEEFINLMSSISSDYEPIDEEALEGVEE